jgi:hypothetical protein
MERIDHIVMLTRSAEHIIVVEAVRSERVQVGEHLKGRALPSVNLAGHRGGHGNAGGDGTAEGGVIEATSHGIKRDVGALESGRVASTGECGSRRDLRGTCTHTAIPQQPIDLASGSFASLADARQSSEGGEGIAQ